MGGNSMGLTGLDTPDASRPGGPTSAANLLAEGDRPGPVGMNTPGIPAEELNGGGVVDAQAILNYASSNDGKYVGDKKQCYDLADLALRKAGAKSAPDYGTITPTADYVWGSAVTVDKAQPGDIIQFKNYSTYITTTTVNKDKSVDTDSGGGQDRGHHTAIVKSVGSDGLMTVWEQNAPDGTAVRSFDLYFKNVTIKKDNTTVEIKVSGTTKFYRPQPKK